MASQLIRISILLLVHKFVTSELLAIPGIEGGSEVKTWFNFSDHINDIKFDAMIPGNYLIATHGGLHTTDGDRFVQMSDFPTLMIVQINQEIYQSGWSSCMEVFERTGLYDGNRVQFGDCSTTALQDGPLTISPMFGVTAGMIAANGGKEILLCDHINMRVRTIDVENRIINLGISLELYNFGLMEHPSDPQSVLVSVKYAVISVSLVDHSFVVKTGDQFTAGTMDGSRLTARYNYPTGMTMVNNNLIVSERVNMALRYIPDFFTNDDSNVETICGNPDPSYDEMSFVNCRLDRVHSTLFDGVRLIFGSGSRLRYIGPHPLSSGTSLYSGKGKLFHRSPGNAACTSDLGMNPVIKTLNKHTCMLACLERKGCVAIHFRDTMCSLITRIAQVSGGNSNGECFLLLN